MVTIWFPMHSHISTSLEHFSMILSLVEMLQKWWEKDYLKAKLRWRHSTRINTAQSSLISRIFARSQIWKNTNTGSHTAKA